MHQHPSLVARVSVLQNKTEPYKKKPNSFRAVVEASGRNDVAQRPRGLSQKGVKELKGGCVMSVRCIRVCYSSLECTRHGDCSVTGFPL